MNSGVKRRESKNSWTKTFKYPKHTNSYYTMLQKISQYNAFIVMSSFHANNIIVVPEVLKK